MLKKMLILSVVVLMMTACTQAEKEKQKPEATPVETDSYYDEEGSKWIWEENIRWSRNENVLCIAGEGKLKKEHLRTVRSFWKEDITKIVIEEGISEIGKECFWELEWLKEVHLPSSLKKIGEAAFDFCSTMEKVEIKKGLEVIDKRAFDSCISLEKIELPEGVKQIGKGAFYRCYSLRELTLPKSLEKYASSALESCTRISKIVNKSAYDWKFPRKSMMKGNWGCDGKDVGNVIPAGKTIKVEPQVYSITYDLDGGTTNDTMPMTYKHTKGLKLPTRITKSGYTFGGWYENGFEGRPKQENKITPGERGNKKLTAIWIKYDIQNIGRNRIKVVCDLEKKWEDKGLCCIIRCSEYEDMSDRICEGVWKRKGNVVLKKMKKNKRYYIDYAIYYHDDWVECELDYDLYHDWQGKRSIVVE